MHPAPFVTLTKCGIVQPFIQPCSTLSTVNWGEKEWGETDGFISVITLTNKMHC